MAVVPLSKPYALKSATFSIGTDEYTAALSQVQFDPATTSSTWRGIGGNVHRQQSVAEWSATIGLAQDLDPAGLLRYLHEHEGETANVTFVPAADGPSITADLVLAPSTIGGTAGADLATASVTMAVVGKPAFTDVPAA